MTYQPVRGFGRVWCEEAVHQWLGWATEPERGSGTTVQHSAQDVYIRAAESGTWRLGRGWAYIR
ncbi:MAG: hypothetical protein ACPLYD_14875, partial [Anaerolineae bacterium]